MNLKVVGRDIITKIAAVKFILTLGNYPSVNCRRGCASLTLEQYHLKVT